MYTAQRNTDGPNPTPFELDDAGFYHGGCTTYPPTDIRIRARFCKFSK